MLYSYMRETVTGEEKDMQDMYHVLVVEDDEQIRDGIEIYLKSQDTRYLRQEMVLKGWRLSIGKKFIWP